MVGIHLGAIKTDSLFKDVKVEAPKPKSRPEVMYVVEDRTKDVTFTLIKESRGKYSVQVLRVKLNKWEYIHTHKSKTEAFEDFKQMLSDYNVFPGGL